jgi:flagellar motor switch/type III secretory pathway protein FliN
LHGDSALRNAQALVDACLQQWAKGWGVVLNDSAALTALDPRSASRMPWSCWQGSAGQRIWIQIPDGFANWCERQIFGSAKQKAKIERHAESIIARSIAQDAVQALLGALAAVGEADPGLISREPDVEALPDALLQQGTGALQMTWAPAPGRPLLVVYSALIAAPTIRAGRSELVPLDQVLAPQRLRLQVQLGAAEITLGQLQSLHVGDVIRLDRHLDEALLVQDAAAQKMFSAYPGRVQAHRAIEIQ